MKRFLTALALAVIVAATTSAAEARPHYKRHSHHVHYVKKKIKKTRYYRVARQPARQPQQQSMLGEFQSGFQSGFQAGTGLVQKARQFIGATASQVGVRSTLWCSAFLRKLTGASGVDDRAKSWESKPRIAPQVGAVVTMGRKGGGHVGVVSGFTAKGDPIVISGNSGGRVREAVYSRSRIRAWVAAT